VIAIIAILAAILFPVFAKAREKARQISCASNEKQLGLGFLQYEQDNDEKEPGTPSSYQAGLGWAWEIYPYVKSVAVYKCPDDPTPSPYPYNQAVSYINNLDLMGGQSYTNVTALSQISSPAKTVQLCEGGFGFSGDITNVAGGGPYTGVGANGVNTPDNGQYGSLRIGDYMTGILNGSGGVVGTQPYTNATGLHTDGSNYLFADGHVKWMRGSAVSAGFNNPNATDCGSGSGATRIAAGTSCSDATVAGTFSFN
jgi:prepilin-type processing-associated H-X9-DG protein